MSNNKEGGTPNVTPSSKGRGVNTQDNQKKTQMQVVMKIISHKAQEIVEMIGGARPPEMSAHGKVGNLRLMEY